MKLYPMHALFMLMMTSSASSAPVTLRDICRQHAKTTIESKVTEALRAQANSQLKIGKIGFAHERGFRIVGTDTTGGSKNTHLYISVVGNDETTQQKNQDDYMVLHFGVDVTHSTLPVKERFLGYGLMRFSLPENEPLGRLAYHPNKPVCHLAEIYAVRKTSSDPIQLESAPLVAELLPVEFPENMRPESLIRRGFRSLYGQLHGRELK